MSKSFRFDIVLLITLSKHLTGAPFLRVSVETWCFLFLFLEIIKGGILMIQNQKDFEAAQAWADLREAYRHREKGYVIEAQVIGLEKLERGEQKEEALKIYYNGIYGYIPISNVDDYEFRSLQSFVGSNIQFIVEQLFEEDDSRLFLGNRKKALDALAVKFWKKAKIGQDYEAYVSGVDKYGVYLLVEGVRVRMERDDYSYDFVTDLRDYVDIGTTMDVRIMNLEKDEKRIDVSRKALESDPRDFIQEYKRGGFYLGTIVNIDIDAGVFVRLEPRGLVGRAGFPPNLGKRILKPGDQVNFKVTEVNEKLARVRGLVIVPRATGRNARGNASNGR